MVCAKLQCYCRSIPPIEIVPIGDDMTLDLSMRRDATVDALLSLQNEPIDFSRKTLDLSDSTPTGSIDDFSALATVVKEEEDQSTVQPSTSVLTMSPVTALSSVAVDAKSIIPLIVAPMDASTSSGVSSLHDSPVRSELGNEEFMGYFHQLLNFVFIRIGIANKKPTIRWD